MIYVNPAIMVV